MWWTHQSQYHRPASLLKICVRGRPSGGGMVRSEATTRHAAAAAAAHFPFPPGPLRYCQTLAAVCDVCLEKAFCCLGSHGHDGNKHLFIFSPLAPPYQIQHGCGHESSKATGLHLVCDSEAVGRCQLFPPVAEPILPPPCRPHLHQRSKLDADRLCLNKLDRCVCVYIREFAVNCTIFFLSPSVLFH